MAVSLDAMMAELDPERRRRIEERAAELIAEEMTLREARRLTQVSVSGEGAIGHHPYRPTKALSDEILHESSYQHEYHIPNRGVSTLGGLQPM